MKLIFLDIDGVLINLQGLKSGNRPDPECVKRLNELTDVTGAKIVVSSTWRIMGERKMGDKLRSWGVEGEVVGIAPILEMRREGGVLVGVERGREIAAYLDGMEGVESVVILDNDGDMGDLKDRLVQTDWKIGLTAGDVERATELLMTELSQNR